MRIQRLRMRIIDGNVVHMARLATYASTYVNGVAELHQKSSRLMYSKSGIRYIPRDSRTRQTVSHSAVGSVFATLSFLLLSQRRLVQMHGLQTFHFLKSSMTALTQEQSQSSTISRRRRNSSSQTTSRRWTATM